MLFRSVVYIAQVRERIPEMEERILFSGRFSTQSVAKAAVVLMDKITSFGYGPVDPSEPIADKRLKQLVKADAGAVDAYMQIICRRNLKLEPEFYDSFAGNGRMLYKLAEHLRKRLPENLEATWDDPKTLVEYAQRYVKGRLPENLENVLVLDTKAMRDYAFNIVRGFANPRLTDALHNAMMLASSDEYARQYVSEVSRIENLPGNNPKPAV